MDLQHIYASINTYVFSKIKFLFILQFNTSNLAGSGLQETHFVIFFFIIRIIS